VGARTSYAPGTFSWVELATTDGEGAKAFYRDLFGWQGVDFPVGESSVYTMLQLDGDDVAAVYEQSPVGGPPSWLSYVTVTDADAAAARAGEHGGTVLSEPFDVFDAGRMAVLQDPQGALFALWQPGRHIGARRVNDPGCFCWNELATTDPEAAAEFYGRVFAWTTRPMTGDPEYLVIENAGRTNGGIVQLPRGRNGVPPSWGVYFAVASADDAARRVGELGGRVLVGPQDAPFGRFAVVADPQGATFSLYEGDVEE
jgi:uncharacterized protein